MNRKCDGDSHQGAGRQGLPALCSVAGVRQRLRAAGVRPVHRWGQNFLCDPATLAAALAAAELLPHDRVLEIGAGLGTLTTALAGRVAEVVAVEIDPKLCGLLRQELAQVGNVGVRCQDALAASDQELLLPAYAPAFKVVANIPYYLTSPLIERLISDWRNASLAVLMVQEEVARRLTAAPGEAGYGLLTLMTSYHCEASIIRLVPAGAFWPRPAVRSAIVQLRRLERPRFDVDEALLMTAMRAAFGQRRKQLRNALTGPPLGIDAAAATAALEAAAIDPRRRAETLSLAEFAALANAIAGAPSG